jgi:hypothetical protein
MTPIQQKSTQHFCNDHTEMKDKVTDIHEALIGTLDKQGFIGEMKQFKDDMTRELTYVKSITADYRRNRWILVVIKWTLYTAGPVVLLTLLSIVFKHFNPAVSIWGG